MKIIFLGAPGAGKGTQAEKIADLLSIPAVSTGAMIRSAIKNGPEMGKAAIAYTETGKLVPDEVVIGIIKERLAEDDCKNGFILGIRPGKPTADYITKVLNKIILIGAIMLCVVAVLPLIINKFSTYSEASLAFGGSSIIIVVGVAIELARAVEAEMTMRHYKGFLE